jgi:membrane protein implicated in regulation of membrane protease activity
MDIIGAFFDGLTIWHWAAFAGLLLAIELATGSTYLLWPAVAAVLAGLLTLPGVAVDWTVEVATFALASIGLSVTAGVYMRGAWLTRRNSVALNDLGAELIGKTARAAVTFENGVGRVKLGDTEWRAEADGPVAAGASVVIKGMDGATLKVRPAPGPKTATGA